MKLTKQEIDVIKFDKSIKDKHNLTDDEFEQYIEKVGIRVLDGKMSEEYAVKLTLKEMGK